MNVLWPRHYAYIELDTHSFINKHVSTLWWTNYWTYGICDCCLGHDPMCYVRMKRVDLCDHAASMFKPLQTLAKHRFLFSFTIFSRYFQINTFLPSTFHTDTMSEPVTVPNALGMSFFFFHLLWFAILLKYSATPAVLSTSYEKGKSKGTKREIIRQLSLSFTIEEEIQRNWSHHLIGARFMKREMTVWHSQKAGTFNYIYWFTVSCSSSMTI